jgi:hypothetical protein
MHKVIFIFLLVNFNVVAYNQVIKGTVLEDKTNNPVIATVYLNGTFVGTLTDQDGYFELDISKYATMPLTISSVGYYSVTLKDYSYDKPLKVNLTPKIYELRGVNIADRSLSRKRKEYLILFKIVFLGKTYNARECDITNENDITFNYDSCRDTLKAFASKPLLIINRSLGYKITYYLDNFEYYKKTNSFFFKGNILFTEDMTIGKTDKRNYESRRKETYLGSRMHFLRSLWAKNLASSGFKIRSYADAYLNYKDIVIEENCNYPDSLSRCKKFLKYPENFKIFYNNRFSKVIFLKPEVFFDKDGNFDMGLKWEGEMLTKRTGDALPSEYRVGE